MKHRKCYLAFNIEVIMFKWLKKSQVFKGCFIVLAEHKIQTPHRAPCRIFDFIVLPKNGSRVGIGNTWDDNRLFHSNGNVFDFIVHYRWNGLFHLCKVPCNKLEMLSCVWLYRCNFFSASLEIYDSPVN